jgi:hypothetical protein
MIFIGRWMDSSFSRFLIFLIGGSNFIEIKQSSKVFLCTSFLLIIMFCLRYLHGITNPVSPWDREREIWTKSKYQLKHTKSAFSEFFRDFFCINCKRSCRVNAWLRWCDLTIKEWIKFSASESKAWWWPKGTGSYRPFFKFLWMIILFNWKKT